MSALGRQNGVLYFRFWAACSPTRTALAPIDGSRTRRSRSRVAAFDVRDYKKSGGREVNAFNSSNVDAEEIVHSPA